MKKFIKMSNGRNAKVNSFSRETRISGSSYPGTIGLKDWRTERCVYDVEVAATSKGIFQRLGKAETVVYTENSSFSTSDPTWSEWVKID